MSQSVRVRYAPSPTGDPHVGNVRTAIFNWLFARRYGGTFMIRVEDTDQSRKVEGATEELLNALHWIGLDWDEGPDVGGDYAPYYQSKRLDIYSKYITQLIEQGSAYRCYCSTERIAEVRKEAQRLKAVGGYDRRCRDMNGDELEERLSSRASHVVRFKMPLDGVTSVDDLVRGRVTFENELIDDFVMLKSDGFPTYHLANVVDDHVMKISHVLRAEEWLPSIPRHLQIYEALGWEPPKFAHLPIILAPDRSKLSKRHGATSIMEYREMGYLPDAMINFLTLLGWSLDDKTDVISVEDLKKHFSIERVAKGGAIFDTTKLNWMNGHYIRQCDVETLADHLLEFWKAFPPGNLARLPDRELLIRIVPLIQERMKTLRDAAPLIPFFFQDEIPYENSELIQKGMDAETTKTALESVANGLSELEPFDAEAIEAFLRARVSDLGVKVGQLFGSLRVATTGLKVSPPLFETIEVLGKQRTLIFIKQAVDRL